MTENASRHEQRNDPDDLTAKNDAVDVNRRSKAYAVAVDHVQPAGLAASAKPPPEPDPVRRHRDRHPLLRRRRLLLLLLLA